MSELPIPTEQVEHLHVAQYLRYKGVMFNHSPNEGKREVRTGAQLKAMGMRPGFPDFFIYEARNGYHGLAIELKRIKGGTVSATQKQCLQELRDRGYRAEVAKGFDEARKIIDEYLKEQKDEKRT